MSAWSLSNWEELEVVALLEEVCREVGFDVSKVYLRASFVLSLPPTCDGHKYLCQMIYDKTNKLKTGALSLFKGI